MSIDPSAIVLDIMSAPTVVVMEFGPEDNQNEEDITLYRHWEEDFFEAYLYSSVEE
jgi:hypothetical protein